MKLIDADKLRPYEFERNYIHIDELDNAPTVDAIPISVLKDIRAEIVEDLVNAEKESKYTQGDLDCGIAIGLQMAFDVVNKYIKKESIDEKSKGLH